jgi:putative addiction module killer protein
VDVRPRTIYQYATREGWVPFEAWYSTLKDRDAKVAIEARLARVRRGLLGDCKPVAHGVFELRIFAGPGYRLYFGQRNKSFVILLCGGDKSSQARDIQKAQYYWEDLLRRTMT